MKAIMLSARIWFISVATLTVGAVLYNLLNANLNIFSIVLVGGGATIGSVPVLIVLAIFLPLIKKNRFNSGKPILQLVLLCAGCAILYGFLGGFIAQVSGQSHADDFFRTALLITGILFSTAMVSLLLSARQLNRYFSIVSNHLNKTQTKTMETSEISKTEYPENESARPNRILVKGLITAGLILVMMIPTAFITDLVKERQQRQEAVVEEVSSRWAKAQTLTGPYIDLPYLVNTPDAHNAITSTVGHMLIIPENLHVLGHVEPETRLRSIYKVLLYRSALSCNGNILVNVPKNIEPQLIKWQDARICFGISDFKGIEEKLMIRMNDADIELSPGLPSNKINETGLSAPVALSAADLGRSLSFNMTLKIKGSQALHFIPFSGNSDYVLESAWPNPSFDGNNLPNERLVTDSGFKAKWVFNKANLPFGTVLTDFKYDENAVAFGLTMVEPADQYAKTNRSVKYAILVIGLTFSLLFIVELMQQKPIHPVQYVLIGLALVIFYSLLLSISEFIRFDYAYLVAALSTTVLIGLYAKNHFGNWKTAGIFTGILVLLYGFIFVLVRLEDTALLVGSIGLFLILAITMYASKKVNWYGKETMALR